MHDRLVLFGIGVQLLVIATCVYYALAAVLRALKRKD